MLRPRTGPLTSGDFAAPECNPATGQRGTLYNRSSTPHSRALAAKDGDMLSIRTSTTMVSIVVTYLGTFLCVRAADNTDMITSSKTASNRHR